MTPAEAPMPLLDGRLQAIGIDGMLRHPIDRSLPRGWVAAADLLGAGGSNRLRARLDEHHRSISAPNAAVAASLWVKSLLAPVQHTATATWLLERELHDVSIDNLAFELTDGRPTRCAMFDVEPIGPRPAGGHGVETLAAALAATDVAAFDAVRSIVRTGRRHLWGNVAIQIAWTTSACFPIVGERAWTDRRALLESFAELRGLVDDVATSTNNDISFPIGLRTTCCLRYQIQGRSYCGTCSLLDRSERTERLTRYWSDRWSQD